MEYLWISLVGAALVMDTSVAFQVLVSQPIISSFIIGLLMGDMAMGLEMGVLLQLLWLAHLPVGAYTVPAGNLGSIVATAIAILLFKQFPDFRESIITLSVLYAVLLSAIGARVVKTNRNLNVYFFDRALKATQKGELGAINLINFSALFLHFILIFVLILIALYAGRYFGELIAGSLKLEWNRFARFMEFGILGTGIGLTFSLYKGVKRVIVFASGLILGSLIFLM